MRALSGQFLEAVPEHAQRQQRLPVSRHTAAMTEEAHPTQTAGKLAPSAESITQLVHGFYGDVRRDPLLGPVFEKALHGQWDAHLQRLVDFWSTVALGARSFKGDVFGKHMALELSLIHI